MNGPSGARILLVEDEEKTARAIVSGLEGEGFAASWAETGEEGFFLLNSERFDALVLDWMFTALASLAYAEDEENDNQQKIAMSDMPATVQKTIQDNLNGGTITKTAKETEEGNIVYEAYVKKSEGEEVEIKVAADGRLIGVGKEEKDDDQESGEDHGCR